MTQPNWRELAIHLGTVGVDDEHSNDEYGRRALVEVLGSRLLRDAVDYYVDGETGSELVRSVLHVLRATPAADRCLEIYETQSDPRKRAAAVELMRAVASEQHLPLVSRFLQDPDVAIQNWGAGVLEGISTLESIRWPALEPYVAEAEQHQNPDVRRLVQNLRRDLAP